jgi:hypothetical protein
MSSRRVVLGITGLVMAALAVAFMVVRWDRADRIATAVTVLTGVAALGITAWAALPRGRQEPEIRVSGSGKATAEDGGSAVSGVSGLAGSGPGRAEVTDSGDAHASGGGDATSGVRWT